MSSGWFDCTEPTSLQGKQGMQGAYALVRGGSSTSNLIESEIARFVEFCHMSSGGFDCTEPSLSTSLQGQQGMEGVVHLFVVVQAHRTSPNHIITEIAKCVEFCHISSGWFDHTKPSLSGVEGAYALVRGGSSTSNLLEPSRTTSLQR